MGWFGLGERRYTPAGIGSQDQEGGLAVSAELVDDVRACLMRRGVLDQLRKKRVFNERDHLVEAKVLALD